MSTTGPGLVGGPGGGSAPGAGGSDPFSDPLSPLPLQPAGTPWPGTTWTSGAGGKPGPAAGPTAGPTAGPAAGGDWPEGDPPDDVRLERLIEEILDDDGPLARTYAVLVVHRGRLMVERYQGQLEHLDRPAEDVDRTTPLLSWSMAKSMLHAVVGVLLAEGRLALDRPAPIPEWHTPDDPRRAVTVDHLLSMRDGLDFVEDYVDERASDVIEMLFGSGRDDVARFAADRPLAAHPGDRFNYSSGTTNVLSGIVARIVGPGEPYRRFLADRLFDPIGATSARPGFDAAGTWIASSYVHATARDFARFGLLYLRDGLWAGRRVLPEGWVDTARRARSVDPTDGQLHSAHWWVEPDGHGTFVCLGYEGQSVTVCPAADLVVVRLGRTPIERYPELRRWRAGMVAAFAGREA